MGTFGDQLRRERELRAISLEEISTATKIGTRSLRALEEEHFKELPGGVFNKGFVRAYARYVGMNEERAVADYLAAVGAQEPKEDLAVIAQQVEAARRRSMAARRHTMWRVLPSLAAVLVVAVGATMAVGRWLPKHTAARASVRSVHAAAPASVQSTNVLPTSSAIAGTGATLTPLPNMISETLQPLSAGPAPEARPAVNRASGDANWPIQVELKALSRAWVAVKVDGKDAGDFMLDATHYGQTSRSIHGQESVVLVLGDPAGVEVTYNGVRMPTLGPKGLRSEVVFTPTGLTEN